MRVSRAKLMQLIQEELQKAIREGYSTNTLNKRGFVEPDYLDELPPEGEYPELEWPKGSDEEGDLRADTRLGGEWQGSVIDDEPAPRRPPKEYRRQAIKILVDLDVPANQQVIDILAWELHRKALSAPTQSMKSSPKEKKKRRFVFFENAEERPNAELLKLLRRVLKTAEDPYTDEQHLLSLGAELQAMLDQLQPSEKWAQEKGYNQPIYREEMERYIKEELEAYLAEKKKYKDSFYKAKEKTADELMASGTDEDDAYGIADTIVSKQGKKKKKSKRKNK